MAEGNFPEEGEIVLCTVREIHGTTVFVDIDKYGKVGVINTFEIAPGRIRNIRDYVVPKKKIVCKVLRIDKERGHIDLSLRRVTKKDTQEELQKHKKEQVALTILKIVLKERADEISKEMLKKSPAIFNLLQDSIENPGLLKEFVSKDEAEKLAKIVAEKIKSKKGQVKVKIKATSTDSQGILLIKNMLTIKDAEVSYIGAPNYSIIVEDEDYKVANKRMESIISKILESAKKNGVKVEVEEE